MSAPSLDLMNFRYRHLGADPVAKQLYAAVFAARQAYQETAKALDDYLERRDASSAT